MQIREKSGGPALGQKKWTDLGIEPSASDVLGRHSTNELDALLLVSPTIFRAFEPLIDLRLKFEIQEVARRLGWPYSGKLCSPTRKSQ